MSLKNHQKIVLNIFKQTKIRTNLNKPDYDVTPSDQLLVRHLLTGTEYI